jgi:hypothetical protein
MNQIIEKINKLLALGERGGTEAEATAAMQKVHELLAKHNLSLDDVKESPVAEEDYVRDEAEASARQPWQDWVWTSVAELYFCKHFKRHWCGEVTYGADAGKFIVTSEDLEHEFSGPMSEQDARFLASALNGCQMITERWESGRLDEAARVCAAVVADAVGRAV